MTTDMTTITLILQRFSLSLSRASGQPHPPTPSPARFQMCTAKLVGSWNRMERGRTRSTPVSRAVKRFSIWLPKLDWRRCSPLRVPAQPKPLQRVSEQVRRGGAGGEVISATRAIQTQSALTPALRHDDLASDAVEEPWTIS